MAKKISASHWIALAGNQQRRNFEGEKLMNGSNNTQGADNKSSLPSALLIFSDGFNSLPMIVPNGGSEELDATIMRWLERKLVSQESKKAA